MTKSVKNSDSPTITMLGGVWPVPRAWRKMDMTITMRTKAVIMRSREGKTDSVVIRANNCSVRLYWVPLPVLVAVTAGMSGAACASSGNKPSSKVRINPMGMRFMVLWFSLVIRLSTR